MKIDGECLIELIGSCRNKVQVYRSVRMPQLHTSLHFHLTPIVMINGSSRRDLLLNSQNFCRSIPAGAENPSLSRLCYRRLWGSRNRRALILGWAYYLDAFSSYPLRTWLPSVYRGHDNWYTRALGFDGGLKKPPTDALRPIIPDNACILCITAAAGTELADAYSPDTVIASSPGKEVHDPWAFYLHAALLRQAFAHCGKFPTAASRRSLGRVSVPVWLIILSDQLLIIALVLTRYSPVRHWKHHFPSDLHVLSMPPAFILSQDRTLHEIHSCITYSFLVRRQS
ncbi:Metallocarboxypeptidase inhibitor [Melia azedarach]|nr:Metallocarboxypeptidase inhibitor [Melia azedarach]KAJ4699809.1 Metallocarboxypeptidase inhibitor [Melia azedarach]KAJ4700112.1 Metallocarboxypeptidase inhibitor [Melia azedarach]KAJ4700222.1 Metallocarboxypeptidase inhibitor [Melia azedarach]